MKIARQECARKRAGLGPLLFSFDAEGLHAAGFETEFEERLLEVSDLPPPGWIVVVVVVRRRSSSLSSSSSVVVLIRPSILSFFGRSSSTGPTSATPPS